MDENLEQSIGLIKKCDKDTEHGSWGLWAENLMGESRSWNDMVEWVDLVDW